ncbi:Uncharacterised protein [Mycobacteroides abscessus subsp. abscessus]|nr:Uncharacterised protein [Mycobacteroides abscessus subsp. abscessus]
MTLRKAEIGESFELFVDPLGGRPGDAVQFPHAVVEPSAQLPHPFGGPFGPHGPPQLIGLGRGEAGTVDGQLHQLFLEQRHAQGPVQRGLHRLVFADRGLQSVVPPDVRMHRAALDRAGPDQRHLDHQVVELLGFQPRQRGHLGPGLDLEHSHRVGALQHLVHRRFGQIQFGQIHFDAHVLPGQVDHVVQGREHAQPEQVELHQTDCRTVVLVPLQHTAVLHARPLHRADVGDGPVADHHAAGVNSHVPRQIPDLQRQVDHCRGDLLDVRGVGESVPPADLLAPGILLPLREPQGPGHVPHRATPAVGDDIGNLRGVVPAVLLVDELDDVLAQVRFDVDVDVRWSVARRGQEPLEQQLVGHRVDVRDAQCVTDRRVGGRAPALTQDVTVPAELGDAVHHQEVARKLQLLNDFELVLDLPVRLLPVRVRFPAVATGRPLRHQLTQPTDLGMPLRHVERRQFRRDQT